ncbi:MAG TPA: dihydrofolate reductase family protein [Gemmatimonadaceae bacterium]|nr:dihydrofolate reductase family protein [Gemmatimonadaceae bacterium]
MATKTKTSRPRVICHMMTSLDGRILTDGWPLSPEGRKQYEEVHESYDAQGWLCGRVTMEQHFAQGVRSNAAIARQYHGAPREDFVAPGDHESFAFAVDTHGRLDWDTSDIDGDHVVAILCERVADEYLASLRARGVSYLLAGASDVDLPLALDKIGARFGVRTLMLEGGGKINGSMLRDGLVDEVSVLVAPVVDGRMGTPALFDEEGRDVTPRRLELESVEKRADGVLWLRYRVERDTR